MVIRHDDRVSTIIGLDESLVDVFVALSPVFERLRSRSMRKVMARLVTVEQAARMAGIDARELVSRLNAHVTRTTAPAVDADRDPALRDNEQESAGAEPEDEDPSRAGPDSEAEMPAALRRIAPEMRVEIDVREELRAGREPFSLIMAARRAVPAGGALAVRATFEPVPLYGVMRRQGLAHFTEQLHAEDWRVWFFADDAAPAPPEPSASTPRDAGDTPLDPDVVILDVRGLEPPEPMMRTLAAVETLPRGGTLVQLNVRVPQFLLPLLEERGFTYEVRAQTPDLVRVFIRHRAADPAADSLRSQTMSATERVLDVRVIPPREKHPTIFQTFAALAPGESFVLVNDHDPKPLRYQFEFEHANHFGWEYLEQGPAIWRVQISRTAG